MRRHGAFYDELDLSEQCYGELNVFHWDLHP